MREVGNSMSVMPTGQGSKEIDISLALDRFTLIQRGVQIDHQKNLLKDSSYNQVLIMINPFTKYAEAVPYITASAEESCDHLINTWIARHGCLMTFQSDNGTAFVGELMMELIRTSQVAQAHSTTYYHQTNGLVERQNRTLASIAEGILFQVHDRLGQIPSTGDGNLQQHTTLYHWC